MNLAPPGAEKFVTVEPFVPAATRDRSGLLMAEWLKRRLPPRDFLLGDVFCTTSRWLIYGETGAGKTLLAGDMAGAMASGSAFLNWEARRPARVMYLDGELPAETFKERIELIACQYGDDLPLYGYNREALPDDDMPPLNTPQGAAWLMREIEAVKPDVIIFDSIMCLLTGLMDEESWAPMKPLIRQLSARRIAQVWLHHTGHDSTKGYGTKTREWELDTVLALTKQPDGADGLIMDFKKARLRTPATKEQFASRTLARTEGGWTSESVDTSNVVKTSAETAQIKIAILAAYDRLADHVQPSSGLNGSMVRKVSVDALRNEVRSRGFLDVDDKGHLTPTSRTHYRRAKQSLITAVKLVEAEGFIWRP